MNTERRDDTPAEAAVPRIYVEETVVKGVLVKWVSAGAEPLMKSPGAEVAAMTSADPAQVPIPVPDAAVAVLRQADFRAQRNRDEEKSGCDRNRCA